MAWQIKGLTDIFQTNKTSPHQAAREFIAETSPEILSYKQLYREAMSSRLKCHTNFVLMADENWKLVKQRDELRREVWRWEKHQCTNR